MMKSQYGRMTTHCAPSPASPTDCDNSHFEITAPSFHVLAVTSKYIWCDLNGNVAPRAVKAVLDRVVVPLVAAVA